MEKRRRRMYKLNASIMLLTAVVVLLSTLHIIALGWVIAAFALIFALYGLSAYLEYWQN